MTRKGGEFSSQMKLLNMGFSSTLPTISIQCTTDVLYSFFPLFSHELLEINVLKNKDLIKSVLVTAAINSFFFNYMCMALKNKMAINTVCHHCLESHSVVSDSLQPHGL